MTIQLGSLQHKAAGVLQKLETVPLTYWYTCMWTNKIDICHGDGPHAQLVVGAREETGERADEGHGAVPGRTANRHADHVLLSNVALDEAIGKLGLKQTFNTQMDELYTLSTVL